MVVYATNFYKYTAEISFYDFHIFSRTPYDISSIETLLESIGNEKKGSLIGVNIDIQVTSPTNKHSWDEKDHHTKFLPLYKKGRGYTYGDVLLKRPRGLSDSYSLETHFVKSIRPNVS